MAHGSALHHPNHQSLHTENCCYSYHFLREIVAGKKRHGEDSCSYIGSFKYYSWSTGSTDSKGTVLTATSSGLRSRSFTAVNIVPPQCRVYKPFKPVSRTFAAYSDKRLILISRSIRMSRSFLDRSQDSKAHILPEKESDSEQKSGSAFLKRVLREPDRL